MDAMGEISQKPWISHRREKPSGIIPLMEPSDRNGLTGAWGRPDFTLLLTHEMTHAASDIIEAQMIPLVPVPGYPRRFRFDDVSQSLKVFPE